MSQRLEALELIKSSQSLTVLTGAGVSVPSGIPDYRSMTGIYHGIEEPEYLLSRTCLLEEPEKFYKFVKQLYHPNATPNIIHTKIAKLANEKKHVSVVTQNIDNLHQKGGCDSVIEFHGSLYECYCMACGEDISARVYLESDKHQNCGGRLRPKVVLYEENLSSETVEEAILAIEQAECIIIVGTSFRVHPFCDLIHYKKTDAKVIVINRVAINLTVPHILIEEDASFFFRQL